MSKLISYLNELDSNAELQSAHVEDAEAAMRSFGLSDNEIAAVLSGDNTKIAEAAGVDDPEMIVRAPQVQQN